MSWSRYLVAVAVVSILVLVIGMLAYDGLEAITIIRATFGASPLEQGKKLLLLSAIEVVDLFLLSTVLLVITLGLYELFIGDRLELPPWLEIRDLNDPSPPRHLERRPGAIMARRGHRVRHRRVDVLRVPQGEARGRVMKRVIWQ